MQQDEETTKLGASYENEAIFIADLRKYLDLANKLLDECEWLIGQALKYEIDKEEFNAALTKLRDRKNGN